MILNFFRKKNKRESDKKTLCINLAQLKKLGEIVNILALDENTAKNLNNLLANITILLDKVYKETGDRYYLEAKEGFQYFLKEHLELSDKKKQELWSRMIKRIPETIEKVEGINTQN